MSAIGEWKQDILGEPWISATIALPKIRGRAVKATLVSQHQWLTAHEVFESEQCGTGSSASGTTWGAASSSERTAVLYIHGLNDYFFQTHLAEALTGTGVAFFALDLHGFGRSTLDEESRNDAWSLREYGNELARATKYIKDECGYSKLVILAHSTGGLIASLWAHSRTGRRTVDGLILNSPWFDLNRPWFDRTVGTAFVDAVGEYVTDFVLNNDESNYVRMLHKDIAGEWDFDLSLKREVHAPVRTGFFRAVREGHARLAQGLNLDCPVLVCTSDQSGTAKDSLAHKRSSDVVLNVHQILARSAALGDDVETVQIAGGIHDLALSDQGPRIAYFNALEHWLRVHSFTPAQTPNPRTVPAPAPQ